MRTMYVPARSADRFCWGQARGLEVIFAPLSTRGRESPVGPSIVYRPGRWHFVTGRGSHQVGRVAVIYDALAGHILADAMLAKMGRSEMAAWLKETASLALLVGLYRSASPWLRHISSTCRTHAAGLRSTAFGRYWTTKRHETCVAFGS